MSRYGKKLLLKLFDHDFHTMVENVKVSLIRKLEQILDDFADLRSNLVSYLETKTNKIVAV